jgi:hypothetical protein
VHPKGTVWQDLKRPKGVCLPVDGYFFKDIPLELIVNFYSVPSLQRVLTVKRCIILYRFLPIDLSSSSAGATYVARIYFIFCLTVSETINQRKGEHAALS